MNSTQNSHKTSKIHKHKSRNATTSQTYPNTRTKPFSPSAGEGARGLRYVTLLFASFNLALPPFAHTPPAHPETTIPIVVHPGVEPPRTTVKHFAMIAIKPTKEAVAARSLSPRQIRSIVVSSGDQQLYEELPSRKYRFSPFRARQEHAGAKYCRRCGIVAGCFAVCRQCISE